MTPNPITVVLFALALGLAIRLALRVAYGARGPEPRDPVNLSLLAVSWLLLAPACGLLLVWSLIALIPFCILSFSWLEMTLAKRAQKRQEAWALVTRAAIEDRPVESAVRERLGHFGGLVGRELRRFVKALASGTTLPAAIGQHPRAFPPEAMAYAALAADGGLSIGATARSGPAHTGGAELWRLTRRFGYFVWVTTLMIGVMTFMLANIVPEFEKIFAEFGLELPPITRHFIDFTDQPLSLMAFSYLSAGLTLLGLGALIAMLCYAFDRPVLRWLTDRLFGAWRRAEVLRLLATVFENRMPLPEAIGRLAVGRPRYPSRRIASQLRRCHKAVAAGADWTDSLEHARLLSHVDGDLVRAAQAAGNAAWALRSIAERRVARASFAWEAWQQVGFTVLIVLFGVSVGWVCIALFLPLVDLIEGLAP